MATTLNLTGVIRDGSSPVTYVQTKQQLDLNQNEDTTIKITVLNQDGSDPTFEENSTVRISAKVSATAEEYIFQLTATVDEVDPEAEAYTNVFSFSLTSAATVDFVLGNAVYDAWLVSSDGEEEPTYVRTRIIPISALVIAAEID